MVTSWYLPVNLIIGLDLDIHPWIEFNISIWLTVINSNWALFENKTKLMIPGNTSDQIPKLNVSVTILWKYYIIVNIYTRTFLMPWCQHWVPICVSNKFTTWSRQPMYIISDYMPKRVNNLKCGNSKNTKKFHIR